MKSWLKGGLIGIVVITFLDILYYPIRSIFRDDSGLCNLCDTYSLFTKFLYSPTNIIWKILNISGGDASLFLGIIGLFVTAAFWFVIGAIIGLIVGKIKNRRK